MGPVLVFIYSTTSQILDFHGFFLCPIALLDKFFGGTQNLLFTKFYSILATKYTHALAQKSCIWRGVRHGSYYIGLKDTPLDYTIGVWVSTGRDTQKPHVVIRVSLQSQYF